MSTVHWTLTKLGEQTTICYTQVTNGVPKVITAEEYEALTKVKCQECDTITKDVCVQEKENTDASKIVKACKTYVQTTTFADLEGTIATQTQTKPKLFLNGEDITESHEEVACPVPTVVTGSVCIDAGGEGGGKKEAAKEA